MAGLAEPIRLREFTNHNPQLCIEEVHAGMAPRRGKILQGLYVGEVARRHVEDQNKISPVPRYYCGIPDRLDLPEIQQNKSKRAETIYNRTYISSTFVPVDHKYTPTSHFNPLPIGAKSPPAIEDPTHIS